ncbi:stage III sporulation protein AG [Thermoanaerobacterium thermosaccharolyticum]|uniref:Stage III sporulation protein AG n=3 Tax=Thermoanaerobacterium thermosaccharolyticum TaxID=1517 RepID=D9TQB6_THETC|nr:stage III sporulation protein AG [Thermoanaerobacterium thermosaccharolyticum]ADL68817.1 stage III sporulation protein AG [Thermoanaerobacterium thermosaccharolyticum DSM 571]AGB18911.1 stage III sporulation protein AG [Thermoanaerobacterium thermosaccharolyticum M0795]AST59143.1 stage III sporulation protein AG [Thermoanaerobacterium thermosaccharolyticum]MBE0067717.1 stage III sporulation protein AG [Thermoanaerobacterium thermosaccharolyticum]MBE0227283.1 stage III sporulation protein AG
MDLNKLKQKILKADNKTIQDLTVIFIIGLIILIGASIFLKPKPTNKDSDKQMVVKQVTNDDYASQLELELKNILSKIHGAGNVDVLVTLDSDEEVVAAMDTVQSETTTNEKDSNGGTRTTIQSETNNKIVTSQTTSGENQPMILKKVMPEIRGVVVVADGAKDSNVQYELMTSVETALGIPAYKVKVVSSK